MRLPIASDAVPSIATAYATAGLVSRRQSGLKNRPYVPVPKDLESRFLQRFAAALIVDNVVAFLNKR